MALSTYAELQASIARWMSRTDLGADIPDFIRTGESQIAIDLRLRQQLAVVSFNTVANYQGITLPDDFLEFESVGIDGVPLDYITNNQLYREDAKGQVRTYSIVGNQLILGVVPATVYAVDATYYQRFPALSLVNSNGLLANHPDVYLFASLMSGYRFIMNEERANYWQGQYAAMVQRLNSVSKAALVSGSTLRIRR